MLARRSIGASINKLLFRYTTCSIFKKLYDPDNDFEVKSRIDVLMNIHMDMFFKRSEKSVVGPTWTFAPEVKEQVVRARAKRSSSIEHDGPRHNRRHFTITENLFLPLKKSDLVSKDYESDGDGELDRRELYFAGAYRRMNALDKYNRDYAEFVIQQKLEARLTRVKGSVEMFYNRIERIVDDDDQDYNELSKNFGFKVSLMRYLKMANFHFEVFVPCLIDKT